MSFVSKLGRAYLNLMQFSFACSGGILFFCFCLLALIFKPFRRIIKSYKEGAPIATTLFMSIIITTVLLLILFIFQLSQTATTFRNSKEIVIGLVIVFLLLTPWIFLSLDLFAYYKRFRKDRKKHRPL